MGFVVIEGRKIPVIQLHLIIRLHFQLKDYIIFEKNNSHE